MTTTYNHQPDIYPDLAELESLPTISSGHTCNLKIEEYYQHTQADGADGMRIWLSRCGVADGMPFDNMATVERLIDGCWVTVAEYPAT